MSGTNRVEPAAGLVVLVAASRQVKSDAGSSSFPARGLDPAPMHFDELSCNAQAKTEAALAEAEVARRVAAGIELGEKRLEQVLERLGFQTDSTILDVNLGLVGRRAGGRPARSGLRRA